MTKKKKIIIAIIAALLFIGAIYFVFRYDEVEFEEDIFEEEVVRIDGDAHFFRAGTDGEPGRRNAGEAVEVFNQRDLFGVSGRFEVTDSARIHTDLLTADGELIDQNIFRPITASSTGGFEICCQEVPEEAGSYKIEIKTNQTLLGTFPFEVVE